MAFRFHIYETSKRERKTNCYTYGMKTFGISELKTYTKHVFLEDLGDNSLPNTSKDKAEITKNDRNS